MPLRLKDSGLLRQDALIGGKWCKAAQNARFDVFDPASGERIGQVAYCADEETRAAIAAAATAFVDWRALKAKQRSDILLRWHAQIMEHSEDLAMLLTREQGKPLKEARTEVTHGASYIQFFAEQAKRINGDVLPPAKDGVRVLSIRAPVGVVGAITPWNFPSAMLGRKLGPALAAGCCVVCKPANETPLSALALGELALRAGIPAGVVNIVMGNIPVIGAALMQSPLVRKLTFTGSTAVGRKLITGSAATVKRLTLELGGNAPFIVFEDADFDAAIEAALACKFRNAGQTCVCANRLYVQHSIYARFREAFVARTRQLRLGRGIDPATDIGPLVSEKATKGLLEKIEEAKKNGARLLAGGQHRPEIGANFIEPTVFEGLDSEACISQSELFGPIAVLHGFTDEKQVIASANSTEYGLAAYVFTRDMGRIFRMAEELDFGVIGINEGIISNEIAPFGGMKASGYGKEGSVYGIDEYLERKYVCLGGI